MNTESPRLRALLAAGAALVVFGVTNAATAAPDEAPGRPTDGTAGVANEKAQPKKQSVTSPDGDGNRGFRCDGNGGAGDGNPALGACETGSYTDSGSTPTKGHTKDNSGNNGGGSGKGDGEYVPTGS